MATTDVKFTNVKLDGSNNVYFYEDTVTATILTGNETELSAGWYVADKNIALDSCLTISGDVKLILSDGCSYSVAKGTDVNGNLTIYGQAAGSGTFSSTGATQGSAAKAGIELDDGTLKVVGGYIYASGSSQAAGIGSDKDGCAADITIYGGNVTATAGSKAAAIGSGDDGLVKNITIYSGVVTANGPDQYGAGIGGGDGNSCKEKTGTYEKITIYGGEINAKAGEKAAGIGSGASSGRGGTITINGGNISATTPKKTITDQSGAGIGGGGDSAIDGVVINGGKVTAHTDNQSSIGAGTDGSCGTVTVYGDMTLTRNGSAVAHTTGENVVSKLSGSQDATAVMTNHTIDSETSVTEGTYTYTQGGRYYGNGGYDYITAGGSLTIDDASSVNPVNVSFENNVINNTLAQGGAIYNEGTLVLNASKGELEFSGNKAIGNTSGAQGGAIYNAKGATATIGNVTFTDNYATCWAGNSQGGAIYNAGTLNLNGSVTLSTSTDTLYNAGTMNWNLASGAVLTGYELVTNAGNAKQTITIDAATETTLLSTGSITIAKGDFSNADLSGVKFTLTGIDNRSDVTLSVNGDAVMYGDDYRYFLGTGTEGGKDVLKLTAVNTNKILVTTGDKWFKKNETITISGVATQNVVTVKVSGYGDAVTASVNEDKTWSVTLPYSAETTGTKLTIEGFKEDGMEEEACETSYTLKVDTVDPMINVNLSKDGYVKEGDDVHWYKKDDAITFSATITDDTSKVRVAKLNAQDYISGTVKTLDTTAETSTVQGQMFVAQDNAGNAGADGFRYGVDGTGPVIGDAVFVVDESEAYVDENGNAWFQQGVSGAALKAVIVDNLSGLANAAFFKELYNKETNTFAINTDEQKQVVSYDIDAIDNVGNTSVSTTYSYGIDGTGPVIGDGTFEGESLYVDEATGKSWFKKGDTSAALVIDIEDDLSGLAGAIFAGVEYKDGKFILSEATPTEDCKITATDNVGNVSEKSKTAAEVYYKVGIDGEGPTITINAVPQTDLTQSVRITINCEDNRSGVEKGSLEYSINGGIYQKYTGSFTVIANDLIEVRAADNVGNVSETSYQVNNICRNGDDYVVVGDITVAACDRFKLNSITLTEDSSFTMGSESWIFVKTVNMQGGTLNVTNGTMLTETLRVESGNNKIIGTIENVSSVSNILINTDSVLTVSKDQFDALMDFSDYASLGKLFVTAVDGNDLTEDDITALVSKTGVGTVEFVGQDLIDINKLTITTGKTGVIGFCNGYGTDSNDTLTFAKESSTFFGNAGHTIDLGKGNNKVKFEDYSTTILNPALTNVSTVQVGKEANAQFNGAITFADGRDGSFKVGKKSIVYVNNADITGGDKVLAVSTEDNSSVMVYNITSQTKGDKITTGKESTFIAEDIDLDSGSDKISVGKSAIFSAEKISSVENISLGQYSHTFAGEITGAKEVKLTGGTANETTKRTLLDVTEGGISSAEGTKLTVTAGNYTTITMTGDLVSDSDSTGKLEIGYYGIINANNITGIGTINVTGYDMIFEPSGLVANDITVENGKLNFTSGRYTKVKVANIKSTYTGADSISFGKYSKFIVTDSVNLGEGKNTITFNNQGTFKVSGDIDGIYQITMNKGEDEKTVLEAANLTGTTNSDTFTFGDYSSVKLTGIATGDGGDKLKIGKDSDLTVTSIDFGSGKNTLEIGSRSTATIEDTTGLYKLTVSDGKDSENMTKTTFREISHAKDEEGKDIASSYSFGKYTDTTVKSITFGDKDDSLKIGKDSAFTANGEINFDAGKNTLEIGNRSDVKVTDIEGVYKLTMSNGSSTDMTTLNAGTLTATSNKDTFSFGDYSDVDLKGINFEDGDDKLTIGNYANVNISGELDFETGSNKIEIGKYSEAVLKSSDAGTVTKLTIGKETKAYLSHELVEIASADSKAHVYDIGSYDVAKNFTSIYDEQSDDTFATARTLESAEYDGWLCGENDLDTTDFFERGTATKITGNSASLKFSQYDSYGNLIGNAVTFDQEITFDTKAVAYSVSLADEESEATSYKMSIQLA